VRVKISFSVVKLILFATKKDCIDINCRKTWKGRKYCNYTLVFKYKQERRGEEKKAALV